ncbi:MAG: AAA family ATPase [Bdellovibrionaceae bacterium]|nr:AAA family ATPase [Pseudobdellovibrionaceae bacterium]MDW8190121.1 AAA family ATPase [Pseudobdellovibrionaceae bacterium]
MNESKQALGLRSLESLTGVVERVTFHNEQNGWSVLKVAPFGLKSGGLVTVVIHQAKVFAGATMEFWGHWVRHAKHGEQFRAYRATEKKPASTAALEKYLGSGLIRGVGPVIAKRIVNFFKEKTLEVFEGNMDQLMLVPGIAEKKLAQIKSSWEEHRSIRDVMLFLQNHGISTLFATKIYKTYGNQAIAVVQENPYRLAQDIYGIGFFSADKVALSLGFERTGSKRIAAAVKHVLSAAREEGHCYLTQEQIVEKVIEVLRESVASEVIKGIVTQLLQQNEIVKRELIVADGVVDCYYTKSLYYDEKKVAERVAFFVKKQVAIDMERIRHWIARYCDAKKITLSDEQEKAVSHIPGLGLSVLTGGPGCGKTTCTKVLVALLKAMGKKVVLAAPTGRAAQRMAEVMEDEAKTVHRLLEWDPGRGQFKRNEQFPLRVDFLVLDEASMLDVSLAAHLLQAIPDSAQILFIGDPDQLPSVGPGQVLSDLLGSSQVTCFRLTKIFRQAQSSSIVKYAHEMNRGMLPRIPSPIANPDLVALGHDCLFVDADEATQEQIKFIQQVKRVLHLAQDKDVPLILKRKGQVVGTLIKKSGHLEFHEGESLLPDVTDNSFDQAAWEIPEKFRHVDLVQLAQTAGVAQELQVILRKIHPFSTIHFGMTALDTVVRLMTKTIPQWLGRSVEVQVLSPQVRGSLGVHNLNEVLQREMNPEGPNKPQLVIGTRCFRLGDRVIQNRNNYDLGVFNGDIGRIVRVFPADLQMEVEFGGHEVRRVLYQSDALSELSLAYAITIHKSQGSEFPVVIIPVHSQHYAMLYRNLIYTALTRAKRLAVFVGLRQALFWAIRRVDHRERQTALRGLIEVLTKSGGRSTLINLGDPGDVGNLRSRINKKS